MEAVFGIFLASLAGSPHCAAMCGPFLAFTAAGSDRKPGWIAVAAYHAGRLIAYLTLGVVAGSLGAGVERLGVIAGISRGAAIVAGVMMVAWGADTILALNGRRSRLHPPPAIGRALGRVTRRLGGLHGTTRAGVTGLATALLPCGWLYAFVAAAGGTGSPARAAFVMMFFWTGTLPAMTALGLGVQRLAGPLRRSLPIVTASVVVVIGCLTIMGRLRPVMTDHSAHGAQASADHR
jgi:sulfite exporter TauE/SafE